MIDGSMFPELDAEHVPPSASGDWRSAARQAARYVATLRAEFTTDPVWHVLAIQKVAPPPEPRDMGHVMDAMVRAGLCFKTDRVSPSVRPECHGRPLSVYRSRIYRQGT